MSQRRTRLPGQRTIALACAAAIAATGLTYAGIRLADPEPQTTSPAPSAARAVSESDAITEAAKSGEAVEVTSLRTPDTTTWARPDGQMARRIYVSPIRAKVDGVWKPIDRSLHRTSRGWEPAATNTGMVFSAGSESEGGREERASRGTVRRVALLKTTTADDAVAVADAEADSPLVTLHSDGHDIQLTWPGPIPQPIIDTNRALYPEILPGADLVLTADDDGFSQLLVVKTRAAAADPRVTQLAYGLSSPTLTFRLSPVSGIVSAENRDGDEVAMSPSPVMWDNAGNPAVTDGGVGATAQPTAPEVLPSETATPEETPSAPESTGPEADPETDEQTDPYPEELPSASDESVPPVSDSPAPPVPAEPTPAPSQAGSAATLSLPGLDGPSPDSHGALVEAALAGGKWLITPDADLLSDPSTVFPVFIDPSVKKHVQNWTTVYNRYPNATFYNGKGFNKGGTHEARVGFESDTWGTSRSFLNIDFDSSLKGAVITKATLRLLETYSWSCTDRAMSVHLTGEINSKTNWKNAPKLNDGNKITTRSFAHGYNSGCRDAYETFDVKKSAQKAADKGADSITFGMRAVNEDSQYSWKKFAANGDNAPYLEINYNRRPGAPTSLDLGPDARCTTTEPYVRIAAGDITFTASATDKDRNLNYLDFDLWALGKWNTTGDLLKTTGKKSVGGDTDTARVTTTAFPTSKLTNNTVYSWRVRSFDDAGSSSAYSPKNTPCRFVLDTAAPRPPIVTSTDFPNADANQNGFSTEPEDTIWSTTKFGTAGSFTFRALNTDVVRYEYGFNSPSYPSSLPRTAGTSTLVSGKITNAKPPTAGPNVLFVRTVDGAGNVSEPNKYLFYATPSSQADSPGDFTGDKLPDLFTVTEDGRLVLYPSQATTDLTKGTGDLDYGMSGAYRGNPDKDPNGDNLPVHVAAPSGHFDNALITHNGDIYGGDGLQDLVVRVEGKLWVYPGDGYGAVNIDQRREILLPSGAPDPGTFTQIVSAGDATGDGKTDFIVTIGDTLWALTGYSGATIEQATQLSATPWAARDIVLAQDISGDGVTDLLYRTDATGRLLLRTGIKRAAGGVDLNSLASEANAEGGHDTEYAASGWSSTAIPQILGTPDVNGDLIPDIWALYANGSLRIHLGSRTALSGSGTEIMGASSGWQARQAIG